MTEYRDGSGHILWHIKSESVVFVAECTANEGPWETIGFWHLQSATRTCCFSPAPPTPPVDVKERELLTWARIT